MSYTYRIVYRSNERTLTTDEIDPLQDKIYRQTAELFGAELRWFIKMDIDKKTVLVAVIKELERQKQQQEETFQQIWLLSQKQEEFLIL